MDYCIRETEIRQRIVDHYEGEQSRLHQFVLLNAVEPRVYVNV